ncbi:GNAT family N-acetyltransferase [Schumannella luteola]|uniref:RimJ/RimL family protein N-acetyltransferase n=1 Tax=Schumannella luteola TaxID=472059 RepID=A0A852YNJ4_9MICO|nr:GNAT family N-acetyltransferase [Schumannella luteola]NYG99299.1 RimJ/RimL family protein N-acetyltransferase [Schumannella luteola]TPX06034.1 GNAT family N-acetyltransferase [Schumannella luteola]
MLPEPTARLRFREMHADDLDAMAGLLGDPDVMRHYPAAKTRAEADDWIAWNERNYAEHGFGLWVVETPDGVFLGDCGLTWQVVDDARELEVGYHLLPRHQGHGYATEAALACRALAEREHLAERLVAIIAPDNIPSQRVAERIRLPFDRATVSRSGTPVVVHSAQLG